MVRHPPDGAAGAGPGSAPEEAEQVAAPELPGKMPPFAEAFFPQFEEVRAVLDRLTGFALVPVEVPSRDVALALSVDLGAKGRRVHIVADDARWRTLTAAIVAEPPGPAGLVVVVEPAQVDADVRAALRLLNQRRDTVVESLDTSLLWCGSASFFRTTAELAPDLWSIREITLRIVAPPGFADSLDFRRINIDERAMAPFTGSFSVRTDPSNIHTVRDELFSEVAPENLYAKARLLLALASSGEIDERTATRMVDVFRRGKDQRDLARALVLASKAAATQGNTTAAERGIRSWPSSRAA